MVDPDELEEARAQQAATSEILRIISRSPTDLQPVFESILMNATRLCGAHLGTVGLFDGEKYEYVAQCGGSHEFAQEILRGPFIPEQGTNLRRMLLNQEVVHVPDRLAQARQGGSGRPFFNTGARTLLEVPMVKDGKTVGGIIIYRPEVRLFSQHQIDLVKTFADQAVIAIENVRLLKETKEALEQQTATAEILKVISSSPTDIKPVFEAILGNALRLCSAHMGQLYLYDGEKLHNVANRGASPAYLEFVRERGPFRPLPDAVWTRVVAERRPVEVIDLKDSPQYENRFAGIVALVELNGTRSHIAVPMLKDGRAVGFIAIYRAEVQPFAQKQIDLVTTFASQAVIAIENVRLFNETKEALEQQTATAEVLRVISSSPTDIQPVLDAVVESAVRLCSAEDCEIRLIEGNVHRPAAHYGSIPPEKARVFAGKGPVGPSMRERRTVNVLDVLEEYPGSQMEQLGVRSALVVPLLREQDVIGVIILRRLVVEAFTDKQIKLLETFAAQAVIAIENVRLFKEIKEALEQLAEANRAKSRFLAAASHDLRQPVHALGLFVAQLEEARDPAVRERIIGKVEASTAAVSQLVEALLDISKLDQGTVQPQLADLALQPMLGRLEQAFSVAAQAKDLRFRLRPSVLWVHTDPLLLERIVLNLVANAVRYTQEGGIVVGVRRRGTHARIEVRDTGIGIAPEEQQHIFEEFYQAAGALDGGTKGLGLGLAIVDRLARLLGLTVRLRSALGAGSMFAIDVPLATQQAVYVVPASESPDVVRIEGLRVLLIDDDNAAREAAEGLLTQWGCEVVSASSGKAARALLSHATPPAVIISDYRLGPHELGTDVVKDIRARLGAEIPAVIVSADSSATSFDAIAAEGLHLLRKPLKAAQLRVLLHHVIAGAKSQETGRDRVAG